MTPRNGKYIMYVVYLCANFNLTKLEIFISLFFLNLLFFREAYTETS